MGFIIKIFMHYIYLFKNILVHFYFFNPILLNPPILDERLLVTIGARPSLFEALGYRFHPLQGFGICLSERQTEDVMAFLMIIIVALVGIIAIKSFANLAIHEIHRLESIYIPLYEAGDPAIFAQGKPYCVKAKFLKEVVQLLLNQVTEFKKFNINGQFFYVYIDKTGEFYHVMPVKAINSFIMGIIIKGWPGPLHIPGWIWP